MTKIKYLLEVLIAIITIYCSKYVESLKISNQTLYDEIVDYFFPMELRTPQFDMNNYLCFQRDQTCCICSRTCRYYGTCCIDAFFNNKITSSEKYIHLFFEMTQVRQYVTNLPVVNVGNTSAKFGIEDVPTVASCGDKLSSYTDLCNKNDSSSDIRVIADGFVYKNKYCALCHGFGSHTPVSLEMVDCKATVETSGIKLTVPNESCTLRIREHNGYKKDKKFDEFKLVSELTNVTCSKRDTDLCFYSYFALISTSRSSYKNPYCANCKGETGLKNEICLDCTSRFRGSSKPDTKSCQKRNTRKRLPHFRLLISFDEHGKFSSILKSGSPICFCNQYFDVFTNQCKTKSDYICDKSIPSVKDLITHSNLLEQNTTGEELTPSLKVIQKTYQCIKQMKGIAINTTSIVENFDFVQIDKPEFLNSQTFPQLAGNLSESTDLVLVPYTRYPYTEMYGFSPKHHFSHNRVCIDPVLISQNFEVTPNCSISINNTTYNINKNVTYWIDISSGHINHTAAYCERFHLTRICNIGVLNTSMVTMVNHSIMFHISNFEKSYTPEQYLPLIEGLGICYENDNNDMKEYAWLKKYYYFEHLLSLILLSISIILELLLLIVYLTWKKVLNIPDKNLITLCVALLICDLIGLILPLTRNMVNGITCKIAAIILHFFSLALCTWPCVIAYEIWLILRSRNATHRSNYVYFQYSLIAWGTPLTITLICLIVDLVSNGSLINYGNQDYCWIFPFYARLAVYIVPLTLMNYGSFLLVLIIVMVTKHEKRKIHNLLAKKDQLNFSQMIIKLFLLFGTAELIGLVQIPNSTEKGQLIFNIAFGLLHNILRSARGILMFIIFASEKVFQKYKAHSRTSSQVSDNTEL